MANYKIVYHDEIKSNIVIPSKKTKQRYSLIYSSHRIDLFCNIETQYKAQNPKIICQTLL